MRFCYFTTEYGPELPAGIQINTRRIRLFWGVNFWRAHIPYEALSDRRKGAIFSDIDPIRDDIPMRSRPLLPVGGGTLYAITRVKRREVSFRLIIFQGKRIDDSCYFAVQLQNNTKGWYKPMDFILRNLGPVISKAANEFPAVVLVGPRQSGKTTLLKNIFGPRYQIISLEPPDVRLAAQTDPRGFLNLYTAPVVFDEIQYVPGLLPYIKERIDADRNRAGQYILTGSQNLLLMSQVTESLAGRAAVLKLMPLSRQEIARAPEKNFPWETQSPTNMPELTLMELWGQIMRGSYPELAANPDRDARLWQASYIQTYLERDVRNLRNLGDLTQFQVFLRALAARSGQILNLSDLARDVGVAVNTAKDWISILEASFQIFILRPYFANIGKRLIKSPKVYFLDTGLLCYLVGLRDVEHAAAGPMGGAIFENLVVVDIYKTYLHRGEEPLLYYWRTVAGSEVDLVIETQTGLVPLEIKLSETPRPEMAKEILAFQRDFTGKVLPGYVIHPGNMVLPLGRGVTALPLGNL